MAIKPSYRMAHKARQESGDAKMVNPPSAPPQEGSLSYGKKSSSQEQEDIGLQPKPGTWDRMTMNPYEEEEYPRSPIPGSTHSHLRSLEDTT